MFSWQLKLGGYFISYENGKAVVSCHHAVKCLSVCMWEVKPQIAPGKTRMPDGSTCTWYTNNKRLYDAAVKHRAEGKMHITEEVPRFDDCPKAVLLHFCVCDFASFWRKRWTQLGYLSASDQFRVRATSGAMMARFYRLQREDRQAEARELYETMCVLGDKDEIATQCEAGVLMRADPENHPGVAGNSWVPARREIRYAELAARAEAKAAFFDAWILHGKANEAMLEDGEHSPDQASAAFKQAWAEAYHRRASCALRARLASCAEPDILLSFRFGGALAWALRAQALAALGKVSEAMAAVEQGLKVVKSLPDAAAHCAELHSVKEQLGAVSKNGVAANAASCASSGKRLPTPTELQDVVARAVRPDDRQSMVFRAVLAVGMGWWHETGGKEPDYPNALARAAIAVRQELAAIDASVRPRPVTAVRKLWDQHETELKQTGAFGGDLEPCPGLWPAMAKACQSLLKDSQSLTVKNCHVEGHPLYGIWPLFNGLTAEVRRVFDMHTLCVLSEVRLERPSQTAPPSGPEVDNGGLLPDNRREVSYRIFVPADGTHPGPPATLTLGTRDGEKSLSLEIRAGRLFVWWSRQTFHQVLGGEGYFAVSCWGVVAQKGDVAPGHRPGR